MNGRQGSSPTSNSNTGDLSIRWVPKLTEDKTRDKKVAKVKTLMAMLLKEVFKNLFSGVPNFIFVSGWIFFEDSLVEAARRNSNPKLENSNAP